MGASAESGVVSTADSGEVAANKRRPIPFRNLFNSISFSGAKIR
jgi:hypothetical protein